MNLSEFEDKFRELLEEEFHISEETITKIINNAAQHRKETGCKLSPTSIVSKMQEYSTNSDSDTNPDKKAEKSWNYAIKSLDASGWEIGDNAPKYDTDRYKI